MKRTLQSALLLATTAVLLLSSCGGETTAAPSGGNETAAPAVDGGETAAEEVLPYIPPAQEDLEGMAFRIMMAEQNDNAWQTVEAMNGDVLNDAIYERNRTVEENYNVTISSFKDENAPTTIGKCVAAGDDFADVTMIRLRHLYPLAQEGMFLDWNTLNIDLDQPWWDQNARNELDIAGHLFTLCGDFSTNDDLSMLVLKYNKTIYADNGYENPYTLVDSGRWVFDLFWSMCEENSRDLNGDGKMNNEDMFGLLTEYSAVYYFYTGAGYRSLQPDGAGGYELSIGTEKAYNIVEKVLVIGTEKDRITIIADDGKFPNSYDGAKAMFNNGQGLFGAGQLRGMTQMRDADCDYGPLPIPKYEESQDSYHNLVSWNDMPATMPITSPAPNNAALVLDALGYESYLSVSPAFYDVFLDEKAMRDEGAKGMLDIIFDTKCYDLDWYAGISGLSDITGSIARSGKNTFASDYAALESSAALKLENFLAPFAG